MEPVRLTRESGVEPVIYYANSNIHPDEEYARRLETLEFWARDEALEVIEGPYDPASWEAVVGRIGDAAHAKHGVIVHEADNSPLIGADEGDALASPSSAAGEAVAEPRDSAGEAVANLSPISSKSNTVSSTAADATTSADDATSAEVSPAEQARQARCRACYRLRFEETARYAAEHGFESIGTTLSVSPYQYTAIIREELERAAQAAGISTCFVDYRPYYDNATQRSREVGMYRQNYCACRFSEEEARVEREMRKQVRKVAKEAEAAARREQAAAAEAEAQAKRAEKAAYAEKQARKRAILKQMREQG